MRTPLAWKNVTYNKLRAATSLFGVAFAILLIFMQIGFYDACFVSSTMIFDQLEADIVLLSPQYIHLRSAGTFPRNRIYQARAVTGVYAATPVYVVNGLWRSTEKAGKLANFPDKSRAQKEIVVLGVDPGDQPFRLPELCEEIASLREDDTAIMDVKTGKGYGAIRPGTETELDNRRIRVVNTYSYGTGFICDASIIISDRTLSRIYSGYPLNEVTIGLVKLRQGVAIADAIRDLKAELPSDVQVWSRKQLEASEQHYFVKIKPLGIMFFSGVILALFVGAVILYQILASEIMNRLKEYATLKAIGYSNGFMNRVVLQQATIFALFGFVPAWLLARVLYALTKYQTNLPMEMTRSRVIEVLVLSVVMCSISGLLVSRKVSKADPADLF